MAPAQREGVLVQPQRRLSDEQIRLIDGVSRELLEDPGLGCYNVQAAELLRSAGARVEDAGDCQRVRLPARLVDRALDTAPSTVVLGAREPSNRLVLDAHEPRVRFGSGSETNTWLEVDFDGDQPRFTPRSGSLARLADSAHLAEHLEHLDFFIRNVNIQDAAITEANKDVNQFFTSLNHIRKHVQAGLVSLDALDDVIRMGQMVAGGETAFQENPVLSFITCVVKSPLQIVDDTASKLLAISKRRVPVVVSSCPMGGATGPFDEFGMVAQINAEILAGIVLNQLAAPGAPVLYGAVPVRTRLDNFNDMYAAPEVIHYSLDCAQMARFYGLPCYSTAGVADAEVPGIQAAAEKMFTLLAVPASGAQYVHYAFGLLERTKVFCPEQAILDNAHIDLVKRTFAAADIGARRRGEVLAMVREVMETGEKTFMYHVPLPTRDPVYVRFPLEDQAGGALAAAHRRYRECMQLPRHHLSPDLQRDITKRIPGLLAANAHTVERSRS
jgi:trimethylamine---corrinoid protein Co-methyltransferase